MCPNIREAVSYQSSLDHFGLIEKGIIVQLLRLVARNNFLTSYKSDLQNEANFLG